MELFSKITKFENLLLASKKAVRGKKQRPQFSEFILDAEKNILDIQTTLQDSQYKPGDYFVFQIRDPKPRKIAAAPLRDRVVHHAICNILEPIFERRLISDTYACRKGKGAHAAINRLWYFSRKNSHFLKCDIRKYFESIDHEILKSILGRTIKDEKVIQLLNLIIDHREIDAIPGRGIPIGNLTSQYFANLFLGELDHFIKDYLGFKSYVRYMDDFVVLTDSKSKLHRALELIEEFLASKLKLSLKEKATRISPVSEGIPFLGVRVFPSLVRLQRQNLIRINRKLKNREREYLNEEIDEQEFLNSIQSLISHKRIGMMIERKARTA